MDYVGLRVSIWQITLVDRMLEINKISVGGKELLLM